MAEVAWQVLEDRKVEIAIRKEFEEDKVARELIS